MEKQKPQAGFTLLELLIVIAIIGLLASLLLVSYDFAIEKARMANTEKTFKQIHTSILVTRLVEENTLRNITGSGCSDCACRNAGDLSILPISHQCILNWENVAHKIGLPIGVRDGWGSPFLLDENEGEQFDNPCRADLLRSAGPDRLIGGTDDISTSVAFYLSECNY